MSIQAPLLNIESQDVQSESFILSAEVIDAAVQQAGRRLAPLWPLKSFVAVNPYLGLTEQTFAEAAQLLGRRAGARMTAPRAFYAAGIQSGRITDADLEVALATTQTMAHAPQDVAALKAFALDAAPERPFETLPTVADAAAEVTGQAWDTIITESISRWAAAHFDEGQAYWPSPWKKLSPYAAWRAEAALDRTPEVSGVGQFRQTVSQLPEEAVETIAAAVKVLGIPAEGVEAYLHRLYLTIHGWASYGRYQLWEAELRGQEDNTLTELLAIRLAWEVALFRAFEADGIGGSWQMQKNELVFSELKTAAQTQLAGELLLQVAFDHAHQRELIAKFNSTPTAPKGTQKQVQIAFCIDVRSEIFRRALESTDSAIETIGFAGFFGFPIEYVRLGETAGGAQCPALLTPQFVITETVDGADAAELAAITEKRTMRQQVGKAWRMFKFGAVSCFGFVGPVGFAYLKNLVTDTFGWGRPVPHPATYGLDGDVHGRLAPTIEPQELGGRLTGMTAEQRLDVAEGVLKAMSLTHNFARLVILAGHGSTTVNNPYATGLDCGACGGHSGEANARVAIRVLNDPFVRSGLRERGIVVPEETVFVAAQHDTTTDEVTIFDKNHIPASHAADLAQIEANLATAAQLARAERAPLLQIDAEADVDAAVIGRSRDWSQVRPEWGLAGCAAFIVAPRERTYGLDLGGRSFLHNYNWRSDTDYNVLELIMTAPMVVTNWINLQYFGSAVDNELFGSGNKVLHNVVGTLGVLEGNGGDLRVGLPWQSVHDGEKFVHEPVRLSVMIEAPLEAMNDILAKHDGVRQLVDNGWLYLFAISDEGQVAHQYVGDLRWKMVSAE